MPCPAPPFKSKDKTPEQFIDLMSRFYGPTMNAVAAAQASGKEEDLKNQLLQLARQQNTSANGGTDIPAIFMRVTVSL